jgi:ribosomal protein S7
MFTKDKITNHLTQKGKKTKSEKILNKSIKELQKNSKKQTKRLIQLSLILSSIIFKIRTIKNKKNRKQKAIVKPTFIANQNKRFSFAIKLIVLTAKENSTNCFHNKLKDEFFSTAQFKSRLIKTKKDLEKQALKEKHLFKYYRWT